MNGEQERFQRLIPRVKAYARTIATKHGLPADEVEQEMWVAILSHADRYDNRNLLIKAGLDARRQLHRQGKVGRYFPQTTQVVSDFPRETESTEDNFIDSLTDGNVGGIEDHALRSVAVAGTVEPRAQIRRRVTGLQGVRRQVAEGLMAGQRPSEIAEALGCSRPSVSYHIRQLRTAFEPYRFLCSTL